MKATHPTHGEVEIVRKVDSEKTLCRLANGVEIELTTAWLSVKKEKGDVKPD